MDGSRVLAGKVVSGSKRAAYFTRLDWVQSQCREKLGFTPYPGTLNLMVQEADLAVLASVKREEAIELVPGNPEFCVATVIPVSVGPVEGAIIIPAEDVRIHGEKIIEVMAPVRLKDALNVRDGDSVTLILK
ncbi:MAG: CTP-dependent riboflavin kinase [Proteobacteria bacterium]|nr:CTP-dependent riboflavin kinase [Pseudomonadota bacterium]